MSADNPVLSHFWKYLIEEQTGVLTLELASKEEDIVDGQPTKLTFQFMPETFDDSYGTEWVNNAVGGGSNPVYWWKNGGERTISFSSVFYREFRKINSADPLTAIAAARDNKATTGMATKGAAAALDKTSTYVANVEENIRWLRSLQYPRYPAQNRKVVQPPPTLILTFPHEATDQGNEGVKLHAFLGGGVEDTFQFRCIMTNCKITYNKLFVGGTPRLATVDLAFTEVVQNQNGIAFWGRNGGF